MATRISKIVAGFDLVENLMHVAFDKPRSPRSDAYKLGARWILNFHAVGLRTACPFKLGTAEADAFFAGRDEGKEIWHAHLVANKTAEIGA